MVNVIVVRTIAERIISGGLNPKTQQQYMLSDITNLEYKNAVENYINSLA